MDTIERLAGARRDFRTGRTRQELEDRGLPEDLQLDDLRLDVDVRLNDVRSCPRSEHGAEHQGHQDDEDQGDQGVLGEDIALIEQSEPLGCTGNRCRLRYLNGRIGDAETGSRSDSVVPLGPGG